MAASSQLRWVGLGHELVGLDHGQVGQAAEVRLEAPDPFVGRQHGVVVGRGVLVVDVVAVDRDLVPGAEVADEGADPEHDPGGIGADHVVRQGVAGPPDALPGQPVEEAEGGEGLEDRGPDGVEVDGRGHDGDVGLVGGQLGDGHLRDVEGLAGVLVGRIDPGEHVDLVPRTKAAR